MMKAQDNYIFLPVDYPKIHVDFELVKTLSATKPGGKFTEAVWNSLILRTIPAHQGHGLVEQFNTELNWQWTGVATKHFPNLITWIEGLPFKKVTYVIMLGTKNDAAAHKDFAVRDELFPQVMADNEPAYYRCFLHGVNQDSFYFADKGRRTRDFSGGQRRLFPRIPDDTNCFLISANECFHGSIFSTGPRTAIVICGELDVPKHQALIQKSLKKYENYAVRLSELMNRTPEPDVLCLEEMIGRRPASLGSNPPY